MKYLVLTFCLLLIACEGKFIDSQVQDYVVVNSENIRSNEFGEIGGSGSILYNSPLRAVDSGEHFRVDGRVVNANSFITLASHAVDDQFNHSVKVQLKNLGQSQLEVLVAGHGQNFQSLGVLQGALNQSGEFSIRFELHEDSTNGVRLLLWQVKTVTPSGGIAVKKVFNFKNVDVDSNEVQLAYIPHGKGIRWGALFSNAYIQQIINEAPYVQ